VVGGALGAEEASFEAFFAAEWPRLFLGTAFDVGLSAQRLTPAGDALHALRDRYGTGELSLLERGEEFPGLHIGRPQGLNR
jgi:hypothetical protein